MLRRNNLKEIKLLLLKNILDYQGTKEISVPVKKAVIFVARHIGDTMAIYPVIRALQAHKASSLILVVNPSSYAALAPLEEEGITFYCIPHERNKRAIIATARKIKHIHGQIDLCIQAMTRDTTATLLFQRILKASSNLGLHSNTLQMYVPHVADHALSMVQSQLPAPFCWAQLMQDAGIAEVQARFELPIPKDIEQSVFNQVKNHQPYIALNMDASRPIGSLNEDAAIRLIKFLSSQYDYQVIITCSPSGEEKASRVEQACPSAHVISALRSIYHSAAIVKHSSIVISPDTSIIHIASAYNRPTLGIYRAELQAWRPLADHNEVLITGDDINAFDIFQFKTIFEKLVLSANS